MPKLYYASPRDLPTAEPTPGVRERVLQSERVTLVSVELDPKVVVETHKHGVEKIGVVVKGSVAMIIAGEQRILTPGDTYRIPAGAAHGLRNFEERTQLVDVYAPPRTDIASPTKA